MVQIGEDQAIEHGEGTKRPCFQTHVSNVSALKDSSESSEAEVQILWFAAIGIVPERLRTMCTGLDLWFSRIRREKRLSVRDLQHSIDMLNAQIVSDEILGDRFASHRRRVNRIDGLHSCDGLFYEEEIDIQSIVVDYLKDFFSSNGVVNLDAILSGVTPCILEQINIELLHDFFDEEVMAALQSMSPLKASEEDVTNGLISQGAPLISHLLFADDSLIFGEASAAGAQYVGCSG
ncbi:hypothetical protein V6N13_104387 [Hibiscus sabdariffa]